MLISFWLEPILNPIGERTAVNVSGDFNEIYYPVER